MANMIIFSFPQACAMLLLLPRSLFALSFSLLAVGCGMQEKQEKIDKAEKDAAFIMANLDKEKVLTHFPVASFPASQMGPLKSLVSSVDPAPVVELMRTDLVQGSYYHPGRSGLLTLSPPTRPPGSPSRSGKRRWSA